MERWLTPAFRVRHPRRWSEIRPTDAPPPPDGYCGCIAALLPRGRYHAFADARHLPNVEDPDRFNRLLVDWLRAPG